MDRDPAAPEAADPPVGSAARLRAAIGRLPLLAGLPATLLDELAGQLRWFVIPGGTELVRAGEPGDEVFLVLAGRLGVTGPDGRPLAELGAGDSVGELALLSGEPRAATVTALRDCELAALSGHAFRGAVAREPAVALAFAGVAVRRLAAAAAAPAPPRGSATFTLVPGDDSVDVAGFAVELVESLAAHGRVELVWDERGREHSSDWFHAIEARNDFVVYAAGHQPTAWSRLAVRQADALLLLARAGATPAPFATVEDGSGAATRRELLLLHDRRIAAGSAAAWRRQLPGVPLHHVVTAQDTARVARLLTGRGVGLVLSGGGARGFAHIGVVRALREAGVPVDVVGGTSMGAIMAAGIAAGWSQEEMIERFGRAFVESNPLADFTLPVVSLVAGREVGRRLRAEFGAIAIEDLPLPFFCCSTNLTAGRVEVHDAGPLWQALRASIAIPGVLPPVHSRGAVLVDGGTMNNLPVDVMRGYGRGPVIGVDVGADRAFATDLDEAELPSLWQRLRRRARRPNILQILWRSGMVGSAQAAAGQRCNTDLLLRPPLESVGLLDWRAFERAVAIGYDATRAALAREPWNAAASASAATNGTLRSSTSPSASGAR